MADRQCYHCKKVLEPNEEHNCWTTTEAALTRDLTEDLRDAWERLRETAASFGDQRIYASHHSIMFSRRSCYFYVRPKRNFLEVCVFLGREIKAPQVRRVQRSSKTKLLHTIQIKHRDEVEAPFTKWLEEAYEFCEVTVVGRGDTDSVTVAARKGAAPKSAVRKVAAAKVGPRKAAPPKRMGRKSAALKRGGRS